jgi:hypothetical protein
VATSEESGVSFEALLVLLASMAAIHFGDIEDPATGRRTEPNLPAAGHMIGLLELLQQKTRGNLTDAESKRLADLLYALRMRFVDLQPHGGGSRIVEP